MKKFTLITIAIVIIALLLWLGMNLFKIKPAAENNNQQNEDTPQETSPIAKEKTVDETTNEYKIDVKYPEIRGISNQQSQNDANQLIKKITDDGIAGFKNDVEEDAIKDFSLKSTLKMTYEVSYLNDSIASIKFNIYYYVAGMAHSTDYSSGFNYNLKDNKPIALGDFFNANSSFLSALSTICANDLKTQLKSTQYYNEETIKTGTGEKEENFAELVFDKNGLTIIFNTYQVAPYGAGIKLVKIPYSKFSKINNNSELLKLINGVK